MNYRRPLVSYVLPAFNEAAVVQPHLEELYAYAQSLQDQYPFELIVVDDGSSDETGLAADAFAATHPGVSVAHHRVNRGLSAALQTGFDQARGDVVVMLDLDLSYAPYHVALMLRALKETNAAIVLASPYMRGGQVRDVPWMRRELSIWANRYLSVAAGGAIATATCMVRAYNVAAMRKLKMAPADADFNHKMLFAALRQGLPVVEIPACLQWRRLSSDTPAPRRSSMKIFSHSMSVLAAGMRHRPLMWLAIPGLVPGLLPLVVATSVLLRSPARVTAEATAATMTVQLLSMAFAAFLAGSSFRRLRLPPSRSLALLADGKTESRA